MQHGKSRNTDHHHREPTVVSVGDYTLFVGDAKADAYAGSERMELLFGRGAGDRLAGGVNDDDLLGGDGRDELSGGPGMDHLDGGKGNDRLSGGDEADSLRAGEGNDRLDEGPGHGDLEGGPGKDVQIGGLGADAFMVDPTSGHDVIKDFRAGPGMFDHLALSGVAPDELRFEDVRSGVVVSWNDGKASVLLEGVFKHDLAQDDFMFTDQKQLVPIGDTQAASSELDVHSLSVMEAKDLGQLSSAGSLSFDEFHVQFGTDSSDAIEGTSKRDYLLGLSGDDQLSGDAADDDLRGDAGNDVLAGGDGMDDLRGGDGDDQLVGGSEEDNLMGEAGADSLVAGAGHDMLDGGSGNDVLDGGDGADAFIVNPESGDDVVVAGFTPGAGAFDHIAFVEIRPDQVTVDDTAQGVLVTWGTGSILLEGIEKSQMAQDDFMFNDVEGGAFVSDASIASAGSAMIFPETDLPMGNPEHHYLMT